MKPVEFEHQNVIFGKGQDSYNELPAFQSPDGEVISCWELSEEELQNVISTRKIYLSQLTFNKALQPVRLSVLPDELGIKESKPIQEEPDSSEPVEIEFGVMSSRYRVKAKNKFLAYSAIVIKYSTQPHLVAIYTEKFKKDSWLNPFGECSEKLDEIFGGKGEFEKFLAENTDGIKTVFKSIERLV
jgi:hypothetical protein